MAITMQGSWTLRVKSRNAAYAQRFIVSGAASGNGVHDGSVGTKVVVTGAQWSLQVQHQPTGCCVPTSPRTTVVWTIISTTW